MQVVVLNDTRADPNPGCQATVSMLVRQLAVTLDASVSTRPRGDGYERFTPMVAAGRAHSPADWYHAVTQLQRDSDLARALRGADLVVANLEGTFHHHTVGALALGGAIAVAHRVGTPVWAVNGTVEGIDPWLLAATLMPAAHVAVREPRSARWLAARGVIATSAADAVFLAETFATRHDEPAATGNAVFYTPGVVPGTAPSRTAAVADILADLTALADAGWQPVFVQLEDRETALAAAARQHGWPTADARAVAWPAFGAWLRRFGLVVSGRYHVLIFAAMAGVPAIGRPSNTHKIEGLLELLERPRAWARDAAELRVLLSGGVPEPVDETAIRRCQSRAMGLVVPLTGRTRGSQSPDTTHAVPVVEGLDLIPAASLPSVLAGLRRSGPNVFQTSVATAPGDVSRDGLWPIATASAWRQRLSAAGFAVMDEHTSLADQSTAHDGVVAHHWRQQNPLRDPAVGSRQVLTIQNTTGVRAGEPPRRLPATTPCPEALRTTGVFLRFVVGTFEEFERWAPTWLVVPPSHFDVVLHGDTGDVAWQPVEGAIAGWCRSRGIAVARAESPREVAWLSATPRRLLVTGAVPTPGRWRTFHGAFLATARAQGWRTLVLAPRSQSTSVERLPRWPLRMLLGGWVDAFASHVLATTTHVIEVVEAASSRPDVLFVVRPKALAPRVAPLAVNVVVLDDVACLVTGISAFALAGAVDAVTDGDANTMPEGATAGRPFVALSDVAAGAVIARVDPTADSDMTCWADGNTAETARDLDALTAALVGQADPIAGDAPLPLRLALFGASSRGRALSARMHATPGVALSLVFDNDPTKAGMLLDGRRIMPPDGAALDSVDAVVVSSMHREAIARQVAALGHGHKLVLDYATIADAW